MALIIVHHTSIADSISRWWTTLVARHYACKPNNTNYCHCACVGDADAPSLL